MVKLSLQVKNYISIIVFITNRFKLNIMTRFQKILISVLIGLFLVGSINSYSADPPPLDNPIGHTTIGEGGSAPIDNGVYFLTFVAVLYALHKKYNSKLENI